MKLEQRTTSLRGIDLDQWPTVDCALLDEAARRTFELRCRAVALYLNAESFKRIKQQTGIGRQAFHKMVERCLTVAKDGRLAGYRALVPYWHVSRRLAPPPPRRGGPNRMAGVFLALLRGHPSLEQSLSRKIRRPGQRYRSMRAIHYAFLVDCAKLGISGDAYPFCTLDQGYRALCRFAHQVISQSRSERGQRAAKKISAHGDSGVVRPLRPLSRIELDGHRVDMSMTVTAQSPLDGGPIPVPISCMWIIVALDVATQVILGYSIGFGTNYSTTDVLVALHSIFMPWRPRRLSVETLSYPTGGGLPSGVIPEFEFACFDELHLDNALAHLSPRLLNQLEKRIGCVPVFGPKRQPNVRADIESLFHTLARKYFWPTEATTHGKGKKDNSSSNAVLRLPTMENVCDLVDVVVATHNVGRSTHSAQSRLDLLRNYLRAEGTLVVRMPQDKRNAVWFDIETSRQVHGGASANRAPYVYFEETRYTNSILQSSPHLIGTTLLILASSQDLRYVEALLPNGESLGLLRPERRWAEVRHSLRTRRAVNSLRRAQVLPGPDDMPLPERLNKYVRQQARKSKREAARLARLQYEGEQACVPDTSSPPSTGTKELLEESPLGESRLLSFNAVYFQR